MSKRSIPWEETIENSLKTLKDSGETWDIKLNNVNGWGNFWVGYFQFGDPIFGNLIVSGKGQTKEECLWRGGRTC